MTEGESLSTRSPFSHSIYAKISLIISISMDPIMSQHPENRRWHFAKVVKFFIFEDYLCFALVWCKLFFPLSDGCFGFTAFSEELHTKLLNV